MGPPRSNTTKKPSKDQHACDKKDKKKPQQPVRRGKLLLTEPAETNLINLSATIPVTLQQLLLNVFRAALLDDTYVGPRSANNATTDPNESVTSPEPRELDIKTLIQTLKSHLYNRDFDSAFTDASEELLRAYALRWSAARALGYAGVFKSVLKGLLKQDGLISSTGSNYVVCIGGGAGAEIIALAAAWRDLIDETDRGEMLSAGVAGVSLDESGGQVSTDTASKPARHPALSVTAVDIADWSGVVDRLTHTIRSPAVPGSKSHPAPLLRLEKGRDEREGEDDAGFAVRFSRSDVLSMSEDDLRDLLHLETPGKVSSNSTVMVTLMFTLNELFSTSMAKTTAFLLRTTDLLQPGTVLLVVDSPGSYSTLKLGKGKAQEGAGSSTIQERQYPMKFLLDHTLLSVAEGKWERIYSQDSRWWRRDASRVGYDVGEGSGLEDMRYQVHIYRRLAA
ncbi:25S rRNA (uracil2843-N3)-methyltransferase [Aspergillus alliaceus]|uniref:25S rRNA (uracil2843-N3)-methyltransferase n=1 Tax=Petromyces alliaceus TaxID=209559 RepID=UPI0012A753B3|nr:uncharacterized protein BDW43DRAFT_205744 [Aspergillus alliaceus]KAB8237382.1 hypothetical protein BDW43DRAFT_205744 [Aspergillus alliaceus]